MRPATWEESALTAAAARHVGLDERHLVWGQAETPAELLWVTEQLIRANAAGLLVS